MGTLDAYAQAELARLQAAGLRREWGEVDRGEQPVVVRDGRRLLSFSCNDYLGLSTHPAVIAACVAATEEHGVGAGASRAVTGNHPLYAKLEQRLAALKATAAACVFGSGYLANAGTIPALVGPGDTVLVDALAHSCVFAGARLSGARVRRFAHNDVAEVARLLPAQAGRVLIATDRVFSMDGDLAPVAELAALAAAHDAWLLTDDAHGLGVLPGETAAVTVQMGTLSKAVGGYGGYVCGSAALIALLRNRAASLVYSTALPPGVVAAASAALDLIAADPALAARPLNLARLFTEVAGLAPAQSPIVPVVLGPAARALAASALLERAGYLVAAIRPPTVPDGTARLRVTFSARHREEDVRALAELVRAELL